MMKKSFVFFIVAVLLVAALPLWAGGGSSTTTASGLRNIVIGNWWEDYDVNTYRQLTNRPLTEAEELTLEYRTRVLRENNITVVEKNVASWENMQTDAVTSIMAGNPFAHIFYLQPDWAMALYRQNLLYPISDSRAINLKTSESIAGRQLGFDQNLGDLFTFNGKQYALGIAGNSNHGAGVYFNKRLFREAGIDPDTPYNMQRDGTWTWDNFIDLCRRLTRDRNNTGRIDTWAMTADLSTEILDQIVFSNNGDYVAKDAQGRFVNATNRPEFIESLQFAKRLREEGYMMPRPDDSNWDWYWPAFYDGHVAFLVEPEWRRGSMRDMADDWGFVFFPKGPRATNYRMPNDDNVLVVPSTYSAADVDSILRAANLWYTPVNTDWKAGLYPVFRDRRAVDETMAMVRDARYTAFRNHIMIPGLERGDIAWNMWWFDGQPAQLVESVSQSWNAKIADANR